MNSSFLNIKTKIAIHSLGVIFILLLVFIYTITLSKISGFTIITASVLIRGILGIVFSKKKYLISIQQNDHSITVNYLNRILFNKSIVIEKENLNISDVTETNWWLGRLDFIIFSNSKQNVTFDYIDKSIKQSILEKLGSV